MRLIAAKTAGASAAAPASTTTTPSSPTCTPMFAPAPAITKKAGRTSRISTLFDGAAVTCDAEAFRASRPPPLRESDAQTPAKAATRTRRHQSDNVIVIIRRTAPRRLTHNLSDQQESDRKAAGILVRVFLNAVRLNKLIPDIVTFSQVTQSVISAMRTVVFVITVVVAASLSAHAENHQEFRVRRTSQPPKIDGILDDEVWRQAPLELGDWIAYNPLRGGKSEQRTDVQITYDDRYIYFGIHCFDTEPS